MEIAVWYDFLEGTLTSVGFGVLGTCEPAEEVGGTIVKTVGDEVVADTDLAGSRVDRTRTIEGERHKEMHQFVCSSVLGVNSPAWVSFSSCSRAYIVIRNFCSA